MATPVIMPRQGNSVESCIIVEWHKQIGDPVHVGDVLFSYETDKASFEEESQVEGILLDRFFNVDDDVPCLVNVCVIGETGESTAEFNPNGAQEQKTPENDVKASSDDPGHSSVGSTNTVTLTVTDVTVSEIQAADNAEIQIQSENGLIKISPRAKHLAEKQKLNYLLATPTGPNGRIIEKDILTLEKEGVKATSAAFSGAMATNANIAGTGLGGRVTTADIAAASNVSALSANTGNVAAAAMVKAASTQTLPEFEDVKLPNIRKVIAKAMLNSISTTCQLTLNASFDATEIMNYRAKIKQSTEKLGLANITLNDIILYAVSRTLLKHRDLNALFLDDKMRYYNTVNLGVAVDTDRGLMVPTIFGADTLSLNEMAIQIKELANACKSGTINPDKLQGGSFTVTNLGALGIESFTPVLNAPQTGILGVNNIVQRIKEVNGQITSYPAMGLSLTFDHRALDGAPAAKFLKDLSDSLENFSVMLAK